MARGRNGGSQRHQTQAWPLAGIYFRYSFTVAQPKRSLAVATSVASPKESEMKTQKTIRLVVIGRAATLTRAELQGQFEEIGVLKSRTPM